MDAAQVIKVRDSLKCGKNLPLRLTIDDEVIVVDEASAFQFVKWNDDERLLYHFILPNPQTDITPSNIQGCISVRCVAYDSITAIEVPYVPVTDLDSLFNSLASETNTTFTDEWKDYIKGIYKEALDPNRVTMSPLERNIIHKAKVVEDRDSYYDGRFTTNFQETRPSADNNALVDKRMKEAIPEGAEQPLIKPANLKA